jgi:hypothetical protein
VLPSRITSKSITSPGAFCRICSPIAAEFETVRPSMATTTSPSRRPAEAAGPLGSTNEISAPSRITTSPSTTYTTNNSAMAMNTCMREPAVMTSMRFG